MLFSLSLIGRDDYQPDELQDKSIAQLFAEERFNLVSWEVTAISDKVGAFIRSPADAYAQDEQTELVKTYLEQANTIAQLSRELNRRAVNSEESSANSDNGAADNADNATEERTVEAIQADIDQLRADQEQIRLAVEQVIQNQVGEALVAADIAIGDQVAPPVLFSFTEPPKKLVVSPRDRIETRYAQMIDADISIEQIQQNETSIRDEQDLSAYVTNIGGLGAFPTMVIDRASLGWILSTVAHEWVHNYLTFFPLGINYGKSNEITIINETVADIIGDEIGFEVAKKYYPEALPATPTPPTPTPAPVPAITPTVTAAITSTTNITPTAAAPEFNFRTEMRETRIEVDRLLGDKKVDEAEAYMEKRRLEFVDNGYNLRVLNQAYFAFHGSYGTSAASTSEIGPKLEQLREESGSLKAFLEMVRWISSEAEIDALLEQ